MQGTNPLHEAAGKGKTHALAHLLSPSHDANVYAVDNVRLQATMEDDFASPYRAMCVCV